MPYQDNSSVPAELLECIQFFSIHASATICLSVHSSVKKMKTQLDKLLIQEVSSAIEAAYLEACPVANGDPNTQVKVAEVAIRRWLCSSHRGVEPKNRDARIMDLAKGLAAFLEADQKLIGPLILDYQYLASKIAATIQKKG